MVVSMLRNITAKFASEFFFFFLRGKMLRGKIFGDFWLWGFLVKGFFFFFLMGKMLRGKMLGDFWLRGFLFIF